MSKSNVFALPPELTPLADQSIAAHARICAGLGCPPKEIVDIVKDRAAVIGTQLSTGRDVKTHPPRPVEIPFRELDCFCLDFFVAGGAQFAGPSGDEHVSGASTASRSSTSHRPGSRTRSSATRTSSCASGCCQSSACR